MQLRLLLLFCCFLLVLLCLQDSCYTLTQQLADIVSLTQISRFVALQALYVTGVSMQAHDIVWDTNCLNASIMAVTGTKQVRSLGTHMELRALFQLFHIARCMC